MKVKQVICTRRVNYDNAIAYSTEPIMRYGKASNAKSSHWMQIVVNYDTRSWKSLFEQVVTKLYYIVYTRVPWLPIIYINANYSLDSFCSQINDANEFRFVIFSLSLKDSFWKE